MIQSVEKNERQEYVNIAIRIYYVYPDNYVNVCTSVFLISTKINSLNLYKLIITVFLFLRMSKKGHGGTKE